MQMGLVATVGDAVGARRAVFKVSQKIGNGVHRWGLHANAGPRDVEGGKEFVSLRGEDTCLGEGSSPHRPHLKRNILHVVNCSAFFNKQGSHRVRSA